MLVLLVFLFAVFAALAVLILSAVSDFKSFTIPNHYSLAVIGLFVVAFSAVNFLNSEQSPFFSLTSHVFGFVVVLGATVLLYALKLLGAGDSKLMAALGLWLGLSGLVPFLFYMSVGGGVLAAVTLYLKRHPKFPNAPEGSWLSVAQKGDQRLPYGIAIAFGGVMAFLMNGYVDPATWIALVQ